MYLMSAKEHCYVACLDRGGGGGYHAAYHAACYPGDLQMSAPQHDIVSELTGLACVEVSAVGVYLL